MFAFVCVIVVWLCELPVNYDATLYALVVVVLLLCCCVCSVCGGDGDVCECVWCLCVVVVAGGRGGMLCNLDWESRPLSNHRHTSPHTGLRHRYRHGMGQSRFYPTSLL